MNDTLLKLRIFLSAELNLARLTARRLANRATVLAIGAGLLLLAVVMVNVGAYQHLIQTYSTSAAAFMVAFGDGVLAVIAIFIASRIRPGPEEELAREIREMAIDELTADVDELKDQVGKVGSDVKRIRSGFSILSKGGSIGAGVAALAPIIATVIEAVKEHRKANKEKKAQPEQEAPE